MEKIQIKPSEDVIKLTDVYKIALHHRFQWEEAQQSYVILFPEGMVKLHGGAGEVMKLVDGKATVGDVVESLKAKFPEAENIKKDIIGMFEMAYNKAWIRKL
jgi:pyrroloquinoline quinone biosynthesis protein D